MIEHRHLAQRIDLSTIPLAAPLAFEEVDENRFPVGAAQIEHQRHLVGISGFT